MPFATVLLCAFFYSPNMDCPMPDFTIRWENADHAVSRFVFKHGFSANQAFGIVGNLIQESVMDPTIVGDKGRSHGLGQWNNGSDINSTKGRLADLKAFAEKNGTDWHDLDTQIDFVVYELRTSEKAAMKRLIASTTIEQATKAMIGYERPQGYSVANPENGHGYAKRLANAYAMADRFGAPHV